jgi:adenylate cyclase
MERPPPQTAPLDEARAALASLRGRGVDPAFVAHLATLLDAATIEQTALAHKASAQSRAGDRELERARILQRVAQIVNASVDLTTVLRSVLDTAVDALRAQRGFLMLENEETHRLEIVVEHNIGDDDKRLSSSIVNTVFATGELVITTDAQNDPRFNAQNSVRALHLRSIVCVPLIVKDRRIGVAYLDSRLHPDLFGRQDPEMLEALANQAALAIENARLFAKERARLREIARLERMQTAVLGAITSGVITLDAERRVASFNDAAARTFGIDASVMIGKSVGALDALMPGFSSLLEHGFGGLVPIDVRAHHATRGELALQARIAPLTVGDGESGVAIAIADLTEQRELERRHTAQVARSRSIELTFSRYLAPHVVASLMREPESVRLGGERSAATIVFADIAGFTQIASEMQAEAVVELLNAYFKETVRTVFRFEGLLDKFYGDGLMAVFGPPRARPDDANRALKAALAMRDAIAAIRSQLARPLEMSIGIASGDVVAGHIGSAERVDYTVIGDAVNLANRLQGAAPPHAIYCDEETWLRAGLSVPFEQLSARVKGRDALVTIYSV